MGRFSPPSSPCPFPEAEVRLLMEPGATGRGVVDVVDGAARIFVEAADATAVGEVMAATIAWWQEETTWT